MPAYIRRYPFMLAKVTQDTDTMSLCFDPKSGLVGEFDEGQPLFDGEEPTEATKGILKFCEEFEVSAQRTGQFMEDLKKMDLLMDGEFTIQRGDDSQPFVYRGFRMVDEEKLRDLRGDELRKMNQSGLLPLIFAHLFSLSQIRDVFGRQVEQGKGPVGAPQPIPAEV